METITINVDETLARKFRTKAEEKFGKGKGHLGKAVSEALDKWTGLQDDHLAAALKIMDKGIRLDLKYGRRSELYAGTD